MRRSVNAKGSGVFTVPQLRELLNDLPITATIHIRADEEQLEGHYWILSAEWENEDEEN